MDASVRPLLLLVDDDSAFSQVLGRALVRHGFEVVLAGDATGAMRQLDKEPPEFAVVDLKLPGPSGLTLISAILDSNPLCRIVVLTGFATIATAVEAIKLGATYYLSKPAEADEIIAAFGRVQGDAAAFRDEAMPVDQLEWDYIQRTLAEHGGNISATARALRMHRRTLQRKLARHANGSESSGQ